jgi:hypothetical protein
LTVTLNLSTLKLLMNTLLHFLACTMYCLDDSGSSIHISAGTCIYATMFCVMFYGSHVTASYLAVYTNYEQYCPLLMTSNNQQLDISIILIIWYYYYSTATSFRLVLIYWSLRLLICPAKKVGSRCQPCLANFDRSFSSHEMALTLWNLA